MELLDELIGFYRLPFEKFLNGVTHEGWIEMSIDDVVALGMKHGLDWKSLVQYVNITEAEMLRVVTAFLRSKGRIYRFRKWMGI